MQKSLYEQLRDADADIERMIPDIWYDIWPDQNHGIVYGGKLVNYKKSNKQIHPTLKRYAGVRIVWTQLFVGIIKMAAVL